MGAGMKYPMPSWAKKQIVRWDRRGMVENICEHGVGHPSIEWMNSPKNKTPEGEYIDSGIHNCCGCCSDMPRN